MKYLINIIIVILLIVSCNSKNENEQAIEKERHQIDEDILAKVKDKLKKDYPNDFISQKGVYDMQVEAYEYMKTVADQAIKENVMRDYPNDFISQKGVYDMQFEAKGLVNNEADKQDTEEIDKSILTVQESKEKITRDYSYKNYKGAWFDISYPSDFKIQPSLKSKTSIDGYASVFFISPDNTVELYIFSPQWSGEPIDIKLNPLKEKIKDKTEIKKDGNKIVKYTIDALDGSYSRSYQDTKNEDGTVHWVIGLKYKDINSYNKYKNNYIKFKNSLKQYTD